MGPATSASTAATAWVVASPRWGLRPASRWGLRPASRWGLRPASRWGLRPASRGGPPPPPPARRGSGGAGAAGPDLSPEVGYALAMPLLRPAVVRLVAACFCLSFLGASCGPSALGLMPGVINDPHNLSLRR